MFDDDQQTPNTLNATYEFTGQGMAKKLLVFEVRHWISNHEAGISASRGGPGRVYPNTIGNLFYGPGGYLAVDGYGSYSTWLGKEQQPGPKRAEAGDHFANFVSAVRSRKRMDLSAEIEEGAVSTTLIHLANISYRLGRTLDFDAQSFRCVGDAEANALFTRDYRKPFEVPALCRA